MFKIRRDQGFVALGVSLNYESFKFVGIFPDFPRFMIWPEIDRGRPGMDTILKRAWPADSKMVR
jgi:hypothetical protein